MQEAVQRESRKQEQVTNAKLKAVTAQKVHAMAEKRVAMAINSGASEQEKERLEDEAHKLEQVANEAKREEDSLRSQLEELTQARQKFFENLKQRKVQTAKDTFASSP